jgi:hypothetical protein
MSRKDSIVGQETPAASRLFRRDFGLDCDFSQRRELNSLPEELQWDRCIHGAGHSALLFV